MIIFEKNINFNNKNIFETKVFNKPINLNKFIDEVTTFFVEKSFNYQDIKIVGEKIINNETEKEIYLTALEKDIFILLIDQEQIERKFFLERILKIKKDTQTRTIETHFTRIRNKLSKIDSKLKIISKGDKVFLTH